MEASAFFCGRPPFLKFPLYNCVSLSTIHLNSAKWVHLKRCRLRALVLHVPTVYCLVSSFPFEELSRTSSCTRSVGDSWPVSKTYRILPSLSVSQRLHEAPEKRDSREIRRRFCGFFLRQLERRLALPLWARVDAVVAREEIVGPPRAQLMRMLDFFGSGPSRIMPNELCGWWCPGRWHPSTRTTRFFSGDEFPRDGISFQF